MNLDLENELNSILCKSDSSKVDFVNEFLAGYLDVILAELGKFDSLDDFVFKVFASDRETWPDSFGDSVLAIALDSHWDDFVSGSRVPVSEMVNYSFGSWEDWASSSDCDDFSSSFLDFFNKCVFEPALLYFFFDWNSLYLNMLNARVLSQGMVSENHDSLDIIIVDSNFFSDLAYSSIMI